MRLTGLVGCCALLVGSQMLIGCGDDEGGGPVGVAGTSSGGSGMGGKNTGGSNSGGSTSEGGEGGTSVGGGGTSTGGSAGGGMGGTGGGTTMCTSHIDCFDDFNPCTDEMCVNGKCENVPNTADCTDNNDCTDDVCEAGACKSTNNTADCDDDNACTDNDKCEAGACKGTNNTADCDDLSSCTPGQDKCAEGKCVGTRDNAVCPVCDTEDNLIQNCDFTNMLTNWAEFDIAFEGGAATHSVVNERDIINITAGGPNMYCVQPRQEPLTLKQGFRYKFGLVAGSDLPRDGAVSLTQAYAPLYQVYSVGDSPAGGFKIALEPQMKPFNFEFLMTEPDDANVKFEIKVGGPTASPNQTYIDDVYLREVKCTGAPDCDDDNACTTDTCDTVSGKCSFTALEDGTDCDTDGESCTSDVCQAGECVQTTLADGEECDPDAEACTIDACSAGVCTHSAGPTCACTQDTQCNDNNPCTTDTCNGGTCSFANSTAACSDNNICTNNDMCSAGECGGTDACYADCATGNLLMNCDFATAAAPWTLYTGNGGGATMSVANGVLTATIGAGAAGTNDYDIQVLQGGITLTANKAYRVRLNATSTIVRKIVVGLTENGGAFATLAAETFDLAAGMNQLTFVTPVLANVPANTKLEIRLGSPANNPTLPNSVTIDNVSVVEVTP